MFWGAIVVGIGLVVAGMIYIVSKQRTLPTRIDAKIESAITETDWVKGNRNAEVVITEYSDFQCPACAFYQPVVKEIINEFGDQVALVYRHFPLPMHRHAIFMAQAAEAAGQQGKFFEMHDLIFENQSSWTNSSASAVREVVERYATELGLDIEKFKTDLDSETIAEKIEKDLDDALASDISYTPTLFINGELITNPNSYSEFRQLILEKINESQNQNTTPDSV